MAELVAKEVVEAEHAHPAHLDRTTTAAAEEEEASRVATTGGQ